MSDTKRISVEFEVDVPESVSERDLMEWLRFELGYNGQIELSNPMTCDLEAVSVRLIGGI